MMKVNLSRKFLIFNAHQHFLDEFFKNGINYSYEGVELGLGVIFITSLEEVEVNSLLFLPLFGKDSFLWLAYSIDINDADFLPEEDIVDAMQNIGLQAVDSLSVGASWHMTKFIKH